MSEQMVPVLQSMQDYIEHHYLDEMMDEIEAVIDMEHRQHLNLGLEQQDDEVLRCVKLAFDRSAGKIVRSAFWRKDRINLRADMKIRIKVAACADGKILHYVIRYICCTADFVLENGIRRIGSVTDVTMGDSMKEGCQNYQSFWYRCFLMKKWKFLFWKCWESILEKMPHRSISMMVRQGLLMRWGLILQMSLYIATTIRLQCSL